MTDPKADFLPHDVELGTTHDAIVLVANLDTGSIKEIPCGPRNASHINGDRPLVWDKVGQAAVVPKHWRKKFVRYDQLCKDPAVNKGHKLSTAQGVGFFEDYARFVLKRGRGKNVRPGMTAPPLHPALQRRPKGIQAKSTADTKTIDDRLAGLERRAKAADATAKAREAEIKASLAELGLKPEEIDKAFGK